MISNNVFSPEGRVKRADGFVFILILVLAAAVGIAAGYASTNYFYPELTPYQRMYYPQYRASFLRQFNVFKSEANYRLLTYTMTDPKSKKQSEYLWLESEMFFEPNDEGGMRYLPNGFPDFKARKDSRAMQGVTNFHVMSRKNAEVYRLLKDNVYGGTEYYEYLYAPGGVGLFVFFVILGVGNSAQSGSIRRKLAGIFRRGMTLFTVKEYARRVRKADGFYLLTREPKAHYTTWGARAWRWANKKYFPHVGVRRLRIEREDETKGALILGDTGSGKSVLINQVLDCARSDERQEPGVCYDPASEFVKYHFEEGRDFILNPLDERFPNWELRNEIRTRTDLDLIAESFFPSKFIKKEDSKFFVQAAQDVFKLLLARKPTNAEIIKIISTPAMIDEIVKDTETAHKIDRNAGSQRAAVLATLADAGKILRLIPAAKPGKKDFSFTGWASGARRHSWLFFTTTTDTRDSLKPFYAAMLNVLMRRLMSIPQDKRPNNDSWWFVADELHTLGSLSSLPEFAAECRKHGIRPVFGTQTKHQIIEHYGEQAWGFMAQAKLKIFYRCNEPNAAKWISDFIGSQELDKTQVSTSLPTHDSKGRDSVSFQNITENRALFIKEQVMGFDDLEGVWKLGKDVVHFEMPYITRRERHPEFIPRKADLEIKVKPVTRADGGSVQINSPAGTEPTNTATAADGKNINVSTNEDKSNNPPQEPPPGYSKDIRLDF